MQRDSLDFKNMSVGKLFTKQLVPTIMGMTAAALFTIVDGIFVGNGIGSDAIAAVNITAPIFMIIAGVALMFGMGGGILASINLSQGKTKVANINLTQSIAGLLFVGIIMTIFLTIFPREISIILGADYHLADMAAEYLFWFSISLPFAVLSIALPFFIRLTNPKISMWAMLISTVVNLVLDYVFIFIFEWGLFGAAIATDIGEATGAIIMIVYLCRRTIAVHFVRLKLSIRSLLLTLRNIGYMIKLGFSVFLSETTIAVMIIAGNYVFMDYLGTNGVAAYSVICYLFPVIFMIFNATVQSAQPIISYNYGCGQMNRSKKALHLAMGFAVGFAIIITLIFSFFAKGIVTMFIPDINNPAWLYAINGLPLFAVDYIFFAINIIMIGYYTSIEKITRAISLTVLRGILPVIFFFTLPLLMGITGIWLAVAVGDFITTLVVLAFVVLDFVKARKM